MGGGEGGGGGNFLLLPIYFHFHCCSVLDCTCSFGMLSSLEKQCPF